MKKVFKKKDVNKMDNPHQEKTQNTNNSNEEEGESDLESMVEDKPKAENNSRKMSNNRIPKKVRMLFRQKQSATKSLIKTTSAKKCLALRNKMESIEIALKENYTKRRTKQENLAISKIKKNPNAFYAYAKKFSKTYNGVGPLLKENGEVISEATGIAEALRNQYEKVFSEPKIEAKINDEKEFFKETITPEKIETVIFTEMDVRDAIDKLSNNAAAGPDGIPAILLKKCRDSLSEPLTILWQKSLKSGQIPSVFKLAHVIPVHKPGSSREAAENYRPVSLTSHLVKTFERIIKKTLQNFLEATLALKDNQHGFREKRSCLSQLLAHYDQVLKGLEEGHNVDTVFLDFSKAFDKVDKGILCRKMKQMGVLVT